MTLKETATPVSVHAREALVPVLNATLATAIDLHWQVKQAHWNVRGPWFFARHQLFDQLADHVRAFADDLAERVGTLGGVARGDIRQAAETSVLTAYDLGLADGRHHLQAMIQRYGEWAKELRRAIQVAQELRDPATEDLLIEGLRQAELDLWFLESHLQRGDVPTQLG